MAKSIHGFTKTIIIGRLAGNPVSVGNEEASFDIVNVGKDKKVQRSHIHVFGKQKDVCMKNLSKGDLCCIEGKSCFETPADVAAERITFLRRKQNG